MSTQWIDFTPTLPAAGSVVDSLWMMAAETLTGVSHLRVTATGSWSFVPIAGLSCGPDGLSGLQLASSQLILPSAMPGCLLGRLGGSSASVTALGGEKPESPPAEEVPTTPDGPFAIGSECLIRIPAKLYGPLFIGFNLRARPIKIETLTLAVRGATFA
jgi:hypothetical protein